MASKEDFSSVFCVKNLQNSNIHIVGFQINMDVTSKTHKTTPSPSAHIEVVDIIGLKDRVFEASLFKEQENSNLHTKSYQISIDTTIRNHKIKSFSLWKLN